MTGDSEAMRASRTILAAEHSGQLRAYPAGGQPDDMDRHQRLRDEVQVAAARLNGTLDRALARHQPFNPLDHEQTK